MVDLKQSGRFPGLEELSSSGGEGSAVLDSTATRLPSTAAIFEKSVPDSVEISSQIFAKKPVTDRNK